MTNVFEAIMMIDYIFIVHVFVKLNCQQQQQQKQQQQQLNANVVQMLNEGSAVKIFWSCGQFHQPYGAKPKCACSPSPAPADILMLCSVSSTKLCSTLPVCPTRK